MNGPDRTSRTQDEWMALRCQSGEPGAFEDWVAVRERPLLYYATKLTGHGEAALDSKCSNCTPCFAKPAPRRPANPDSPTRERF